MRSPTLAPALLALAVGPFAHAAPRPLRIDDVVLAVTDRPTQRVPLGGVVTLRGPDFLPRDLEADPDDVSHLRVTVGGADAVVLDARATAVTILIPQFDLRPGRRAVQVRIDGRGRAETHVEVVALEDLDLPLQDQSPAGPPQRQAQHDRVTRGLAITRFAFVRRGKAGQFQVAGTGGPLPAGLTLTVSLAADPDGSPSRLARRTVRLEQPARDEGEPQPASTTWSVTFDLGPDAIAPGAYGVDLTFELGRQTGKAARRFRATLPPSERDAWEHVLRRERTHVGEDSPQAPTRTD